MHVEGRRLYLRALKGEDCTPEYVNWLNDPQVNQFLETRFVPQDIEGVRSFVASVNARDNEHLFGIFLKDGHRHIGNIKVGPINARHRIGDVSLFIGARDCWGNGFATEAIAVLSRHAIDALGVRKLSAGIYRPNRGSLEAFLRCGYKEEGVRRLHYILAGERCDVFELGLLPEELKDPSLGRL
jgi:RimJ/RimL family protein N-acetyltransferase